MKDDHTNHHTLHLVGIKILKWENIIVMIRQHLHPWWRRSSVTQNTIIFTLTLWGSLFVFQRVKVVTWSRGSDNLMLLIGYHRIYIQSTFPATNMLSCSMLSLLPPSLSCTHLTIWCFDRFLSYLNFRNCATLVPPLTLLHSNTFQIGSLSGTKQKSLKNTRCKCPKNMNLFINSI